MAKYVTEIEHIAHHRNGVMGEPFYVVTFKSSDGGALEKMVAIVLDEDAEAHLGARPVFVLNVDKLAEGRIAFGDNSYRGDQFEPQLRAAIRKWEAEGRPQEKRYGLAIEWDDLPTRAKQVIRVVMYHNRHDQRTPTPTEIAQWLRGKDPYPLFLRQPGCGMQTAAQIKDYVAQEGK
jgi:hypothetical protein